MTRLFLIMLFMPLWSVLGAEIVLIYPRIAEADTVFVYDCGLDSTFVLGHVNPPAGELRVNGRNVDLTPQGAFLAWLPLAKEPDLSEWNLYFRTADGDTSVARFPYSFRVAKAIQDTFSGSFFPRVVRVSAANAHIRTAPDGSYFLFPQVGCKLLATGHCDGFFRTVLGGELTGDIEDRSVELESDTLLLAVKLFDGYWTHNNRGSECVLGINNIVPWSAELQENGSVLQVTLFNAVAVLNRIRYEQSDPLVNELTWSQQPEGVVLRISGKRAFDCGFQIVFENDSMRIFLRGQTPSRRSLKHKIIAIDPGHGGSATGAIGPLGTCEKDVALRLSLLLANELRRSGAAVVLTRTDDRDLGLYDRMDLARRENADFFISLHANALPDGENPLVRHGSATFYYQTHSRSAAEMIHHRLLEASGLPDDGLWDANLAAVRPTEFPAVLIEAAYLIYPPEEQLLRSDDFLRKLAKGLARGVREYFETQ
jgi:N-acetylmuramoyl-L-alanine amidase